MRRALALIVVLPLLSACPSDKSSAQPQATPPAQPPAAAQAAAPPRPVDQEFGELLALFQENCLANFPDDEAVAKHAAAAGYKALTQQEVQSFLHGDPGRGWTAVKTYGTYTISIELPPYHTCVVRKRFQDTPNFKVALDLTVGVWAASQKPSVSMQGQPPSRIPGQGLVQDIYGYVITDANKKLLETMAAFVVHYSTQTEIEIRLVRSRGNNPR